MRIVVVGAGIMGLCTAMLLGGDGHDVVVVERDPASPPDPSLAWESWPRRGVNQFRLAHLFLARVRAILDAELPQLAATLAAAGACRYNVVDNIPDVMKGGSRSGDAAYDMLTGRRPFVEAVASHTCEDLPQVSIRRGSAVANLLTAAASPRDGVPHVAGVQLETGEKLAADLVVDATGRRSPLPRWLSAAGARPIEEVLDDSGFVYYGRHFHSSDGSLPAMLGPLKQDYGSIGVLTLPGDNGTWSVTLTASSEDPAMRAVLDPDRWAAVVRLLPLAAHWIDAEPIDSGVAAIAKIEDRIREFAPGGEPVATGVVAVADSWACTNPSLGRGASVGLLHALALRDLLRRALDGDPWKLAVEWSAVTREAVGPWYETTVRYDRERLREIRSFIEGKPFVGIDREWHELRALESASLLDGDILRANLDIAMVLRHPSEVLADPVVAAKLANHLPPAADGGPPEGGPAGASAPDGSAERLGPDRTELLAVLSA